MNRAISGVLARGFLPLALLAALVAVLACSAAATVGDDTPTLQPGAVPPKVSEEDEQELLERDFFFESRRLAGDIQLSNEQAGALRAAAAHTANRLRKEGVPPSGPTTFTGGWTGIGPNPIVQVTRSTPIFTAMSGRIGALAVRPSNGQFILGAAQGGIWLYNASTGTWTPKTDDQDTLTIGALAIAKTNDAIIYAATGEGALSGDSYFGNGILKSTDGGNTWTHVSGDYFQGVSISGLRVDPTNADHLYASVLRGRGGARRTTPAAHSAYGLWESKDGAATWTLIKKAKLEENGATDIEIDPQNPKILYASCCSDAIYKSTNGGATWSPIMNGLPGGTGSATSLASTRFSIGISHPASQAKATLYVGFAAEDEPSTVWKSTNEGATWSELPTGTGADSVED